MRDWALEKESRVAFIRQVLDEARAEGIVYGNSGGKDCTLVGILCRAACASVLGVIMPCGSKRNYGEDMDDARSAAGQYQIDTIVVDLSAAREAVLASLRDAGDISTAAVSNIAPRLRMATLYTLAQSRNSLVAGTGNRSERHMGYFTKWGDGACDFNPIGDLTVREVYAFLRYLDAPASIIEKAPSAGLFEGQTDEQEMGISYEAIDTYLLEGRAEPADQMIIERYHSVSGHKRKLAPIYGEEVNS